jgi:thiol-disulfide isomerase/thioredoxin
MKNNVFLLCLQALLLTTCLAQNIKSIQITDERGQAVSSFQCLVRYVEIEDGKVRMRPCNYRDTKKGKGFAEIDIEQFKKESGEANGVEIFLKAEGMAPEFVACLYDNIPSTLTLQKAVVVHLEKKGETVAGRPILARSEQLWTVFANEPSLIELKELAPDIWECQLKKGQSYTIGWKAKTGWFSKKLIGYSSEPFLAQQDGQVVSFSPGMPATLEYDLSMFPSYLKFPVTVTLFKADSKGKPSFCPSNDLSVKVNHRGIARIPNIAGGIYYLEAINTSGNGIIEGIFFCDQRIITIEPGKVNRIEPILPVLDKTITPGDITIGGTVLDADKKPLAGKKVTLTASDPNGLPDRMLWYNSVQTSAKGTFEFKGIIPNRTIYLYCENASALISKSSTPENAVVSVTMVTGLPKKKLIVGQPLPSMKLTGVDEKIFDTDSLKGKLLVLDIWATWCGPCLRKMPTLNDLAKTMQSEDIRFITISKDSDPKVWKGKLAANSWGALTHTWFDMTQNDFEIENQGIPFCVIIDKTGIIRATGHSDLDIQAELNKIRKP